LGFGGIPNPGLQPIGLAATPGGPSQGREVDCLRRKV
jgi:hypothetical protein